MEREHGQIRNKRDVIRRLTIGDVVCSPEGETGVIVEKSHERMTDESGRYSTDLFRVLWDTSVRGATLTLFFPEMILHMKRLEKTLLFTHHPELKPLTKWRI